MATRSERKLNQLQQDLSEGLLVDAAWLTRRGYSSSLRSQYLRAGWLESPTPRVYRGLHSPLTWQQVVLSLQHMLKLPLTVGGRTALEKQGYAHYLSTVTQEVHLYGPSRPPSWLNSLPLDVQFHWHNSLRLFPSDMDDVVRPSLDMHAAGFVTLPMRYSSKERAVLELLDELPARESFHQVDSLMEGMSALSPQRLQVLLEGCKSVKVKRLFLFFADRHLHAWRSKLDTSRIDLGSGKRILAKGGRLDPHYNITVPADL